MVVWRDKAMLFKWRWRFFHNLNILWVSVIKATHGNTGRFSNLSTLGVSSGIWKGIIKVIRQLCDKGVDLCELCPIRVGNKMQTYFWRYIWHGSQPLSVQFPRIFALDDMQVVSVVDRLRFG